MNQLHNQRAFDQSKPRGISNAPEGLVLWDTLEGHAPSIRPVGIGHRYTIGYNRSQEIEATWRGDEQKETAGKSPIEFKKRSIQ